MHDNSLGSWIQGGIHHVYKSPHEQVNICSFFVLIFKKNLQDASVTSSVYISCSVHIDNDKDPSNQAYNFPGSLDPAQTIRSPYSRYSISSHGADSRSNEYLDSELSPYISNGEASCYSPDLEDAHTEARENAMMRYKEKKKARM